MNRTSLAAHATLQMSVGGSSQLGVIRAFVAPERGRTTTPSDTEVNEERDMIQNDAGMYHNASITNYQNI